MTGRFLSLLILILTIVNCWTVAVEDKVTIQWNLYKIDLKKHPYAKCIDGSPGGYWFSKGTGTGSHKYVIHHQGGGWCSSTRECFYRGQMSAGVGSSNTWVEEVTCVAGQAYKGSGHAHPCKADGGSGGILSVSPEINPLMYNWNKIFVGYCDGSSFSSENPYPVPVLGKDGDHLIENEEHHIYYGGHFILDAVYEMFHRVHKMSTASDITITGSSAGGLSVIMHIDYLRHKILTKNRAPKKPVVVGIIDGGFFMDILSIKGQSLMREMVKGIVAVQNITTNQKCWKNHYIDRTEWMCMLPQYALQYVQTPVFLVQSFSDGYQIGNIMDISCMPGSRTRDKCNRWNMAYLLKFRKSMLSTIRSSIPPLSGYWLISCTSHTITDHDFYWTSLKGKEGKGRSLSATYTGWYTSYVSSLDGKGNFQEEDWRESDHVSDFSKCRETIIKK